MTEIKLKRQLVLFDFDGTITKKDTFTEFLIFALGRRRLFVFLLFHIHLLLLCVFDVISIGFIKQKIIYRFFKGYSEEYFQNIASNFVDKKIPNIIRESALKKLIWHKKQNHQVVIVSASFKNWLKIWCEQYDIELLCTELEVKKGTLTGYFFKPNCYGLEKVDRIKEKYELNNYSQIYAYGDSSGDKEMLLLANYAYYKTFI